MPRLELMNAATGAFLRTGALPPETLLSTSHLIVDKTISELSTACVCGATRTGCCERAKGKLARHLLTFVYIRRIASRTLGLCCVGAFHASCAASLQQPLSVSRRHRHRLDARLGQHHTTESRRYGAGGSNLIGWDLNHTSTPTAAANPGIRLGSSRGRGYRRAASIAKFAAECATRNPRSPAAEATVGSGLWATTGVGRQSFAVKHR